MLDEIKEFDEANINSPLYVYFVKYFLHEVKKTDRMYSLHRAYGTAYRLAMHIIDRMFGDIILSEEEKQTVIRQYVNFVLDKTYPNEINIDPKRFVFSYKHIDIFKEHLKSQSRINRLKEVSRGAVL